MKKRNTAIRKKNRQLAAYNQRTGGDLPLIGEMSVPELRIINIDIMNELPAEWLRYPETEIAYEQMGQEIGPLADKAGIRGGNWESMYHLVYRSFGEARRSSDLLALQRVRRAARLSPCP